MADIKKVVEESFARYSGNVILNRAICDARDMLKPSARMLMYSQLAVTKNIPSKPFIKSARVVGDALGHYYEHGDSSCYSTYMRMTKPFAMRYPLENCQGNNGTINSTDDEASMRYTELRLSNLGYSLFNEIDKDTIEEWSYNFDETEKYPKVAPSKGYYNICNGTVGLGIAISSSIPQFNLKEVNESLIKLLWNPDLPFEDICIMPDYATGALLLNSEEIKESLKNGTGPAAKLRSVIEFDEKRRALIVKEIPYGVYTSTISEQIQQLLEKYPDCGIDNVNDASHKVPDYEIYLNKKVSPNKILKLLYKETSLQSYNTINMTVLVDGKKPKVLGLKELFLEHLKHEKEVYIKSFTYDLNKIKSRLHIIDGLLKAISMIDEVIKTIKLSKDSKEASQKLQQLLFIDDLQVKAILDIKLARLAKLEINKLESEKNELEKEKNKIENILQNEELLKKEIEKGLREVAEKFGDERRTKILNIESENDEPQENKMLSITLTNKNNIFISEISSLYMQKRGGLGNKIKLDKDEYILSNSSVENTDTILFFSQNGNFYHTKIIDLSFDEKISLYDILPLENKDNIKAITSFSPNNSKKYIVFFTKQGLIKKSLLSNYNTKRKIGVKAIKLNKNDELCSILFLNEENVGVLSKNGRFIIFNTKDITSIGRTSKGVKAITLENNDQVVSAKIINSRDKQIISISEKGNIKRTNLSEFLVTARAAKGVKLQGLKDNDYMSDFDTIFDEKEIIIFSKNRKIKIDINEVPALTKGSKGVAAIKLKNEEKITNLIKN